MTVLAAMLIGYAIVGAVFAVAGYRQHLGEVRALYRLMALRHGTWHAWVVIAAGAAAAVLTWPNVLVRALRGRVSR